MKRRTFIGLAAAALIPRPAKAETPKAAPTYSEFNGSFGPWPKDLPKDLPKATDFADRDMNRLNGEITRLLMRRSPFNDVLNGETFTA